VSSRAAGPPVPVVGLTGGVAAGKSEALAVFHQLGAVTISSDQVVHDLLTAPEVAERLAERWGQEVAPGGEVDRARVGAIVFEEPRELRWLESILHPLVGERVAGWRAELPDDAPLAVVEVPLLFETEMQAAFDATVAIVADDATRLTRSGDRGTELFEQRSARQLTQEEKAARADHVVQNDGSREDLKRTIERLIPQLVAAGAPGK
jgi:dephospho-CoA kinase